MKKGYLLGALCMAVLFFGLAGTTVYGAEGSGAILLETAPGGVSAAQSGDGVSPSSSIGVVNGAEKSVSLVVILEGAPLASYRGGLEGLEPTAPAVTGDARINLQSAAGAQYLGYLEGRHESFRQNLAAVLPAAQVVHSYKVALNGLSVIVPADGIDAVRALPGVKAVTLDEMQQPHTERSPRFIKATKFWKILGGPDEAGEGVVVGVIDTGIWPEHPSFSDPDPAGHSYPTPPGGPYDCTFGNAAHNPKDAPFSCNNKLIGAYQVLDTYKAMVGVVPEAYDSARDEVGHGTHTASTAGGNHGVAAAIFGIPRGAVSGIAPRSHIVAYKALGPLGGFTSDLVAAIDQAVADGVDVINYSVGGGASDPFNDPDALAFFNAYAAGVFAATSSGNSGPGSDTVGSPGNAPWITTVGAGTEDRVFSSTITLSSATAADLVVTGATVTGGLGVRSVEMAGDGQCLDTMPAVTPGAIVVCDRGTIARVTKSFNAMNAGAGGMILSNTALQGVSTDNHYIPSVHVENDAAVQIGDYIAANTSVTATFTGGTAVTAPGDVMAPFSSRGGTSYLTIKPDVTAPGVQILAGNTPIGAEQGPGGAGPYGELFQAIQGTSMSSPHVAGAAALVRQLHPGWTPGMVRSALMTTAVTDILKEDGVTPADAFDRGSGRVDLLRGILPGLSFDAPAGEFMAHRDDPWNVNLPSVYIPNLPGEMTVERTARSLLKGSSVWELSVRNPPGTKIKVPKTITVPAKGSVDIPIQIWARTVPVGEVRHAMLYLKSGIILQHIPITFVRGVTELSLTKECSPTDVTLRKLTSCSVSIENTTYDNVRFKALDIVPSRLLIKPSTVSGGRAVRPAWLFAKGELAAATPPTATIAPDALVGYLPLSSFPIPPLALPANCDDGGFFLSGFDVNYFGTHYTEGIWSVNGTLELGTASLQTAPQTNAALPDGTPPDNLLAPWWTDLNLCAGGNWYLASLTDGVSTWDVLEWEDVPRFGDPASTFSFQIWLERGTDVIHFAYGPYAGSTVDGTTGAEGPEGMGGTTYYFDGTGTLPWGTPTSPDLAVQTAPGGPGGIHVLSYKAWGAREGRWTNCSYMRSSIFDGTAIDCLKGTVSAP